MPASFSFRPGSFSAWPARTTAFSTGRRRLVLFVTALHLDDGIIPVGHSPALDRDVFGGPGPDVLEGLVDVRLRDFDGLFADPDRPVVGEVEVRQDLERGRAPQGLARLVLQVLELRHVDRMQAERLELLLEDPGDEGVVDVVRDVVVEEAADPFPGGVALAETVELGLGHVLAEDPLVLLAEFLLGDLELDLLAARADVGEAALSVRVRSSDCLFHSLGSRAPRSSGPGGAGRQ